MSAFIHELARSPGGVPKLPIPDVMIRFAGLEGDWQSNRKYHGGPDRAVCLFASEIIAALQAHGHPITAGSVGENVTTVGLDWSRVVPGVRLQLGTSAVLEVVSYTVPCRTIRRAFVDGDVSRISQTLHPGTSRVYARVLVEGVVRVGDEIAVLPETRHD